MTDIDLSGATLAAHVSSRNDGRPRWTDLNVYWRPDARRCWVAEAVACSSIEGETQRVRQLAGSSLQRALKLFQDTDLGLIVSETAMQFAEENDLRTVYVGTNAKTDREALAMLMGCQPEDLSVRAAAGALGMGESSLRMALDADRDVRVPLRRLLPFIDRVAFRLSLGGEKARG